MDDETISTKIFSIYGDDYQLVENRGNQRVSTFNCRDHGTFKMYVTKFFEKDEPCPECEKYNKELMEELFFHDEVKKLHPNKYGFSKCVFVDMSTPVILEKLSTGEFAKYFPTVLLTEREIMLDY